MALVRKLRSLFRKERLDAEMAGEMRHHVELQIALNLKAGMNSDEAHYAALRQFGNVASIQERAREGRGWVWLEQFLKDSRHAARSLLRAPRFTFTVVFTLALGIGATVTLVSIARRALFPPVPFPNAERLAVLSEFNTAQNTDWGISSAQRYVAVRRHSKVFARLAAQRTDSMNLVVDDRPATLQAAWVSPDFFPVLGVPPELGRSFSPEEHQAGAESGVLILSHVAWKKEFGGDPMVIGRQVLFGGKLRCVIGVMPAPFRAPPRLPPWEVFLPLSESALEKADGTNIVAFWVTGLLAPDVSTEQAQAQLATLPAPANYPAEWWRKIVPRVTLLKFRYVADAPLLLRLFLGAAACFYAIACTNAANLMLLRILSRQHELSVRLAIGGSRARIVRSVLLETLLLAGTGGVAGIGVAYGGCEVIGRVIGSWLPAGTDDLIDPTILGFTVGISFVTALLVGLVPAWRGSRAETNSVLKEGGLTHSANPRAARLRGVFVVLQTALATILLIGGTLLVRTFWQLRQRGVGIDPAGKIAILGTLPINALSSEQYDSVAGRLLGEVQRLPGVKHVALSRNLPFDAPNFEPVHFVDEPDPKKIACTSHAVSADYFQTMGLPLLVGRNFAGIRASDPPVAIINESLARRAFPSGNAIGQWLASDYRGKMEIIGVTGDIRDQGPRQTESAQFYIPFNQRKKNETWAVVVVAELKAEQASGFFTAVQKAAYTAEPRLTVRLIKLSDSADYTLKTERAGLTVLQALSALALGLAALGLYAVMAYVVAQRQREFGVRLALGASPGDLLRLVLGNGLRLAALGVAIGLGAAWALSRFLQSMLFETSAHDPVTFAGVGLLLGAVALFACWLPAQRAAKVDPVIALRAD